MKNLNFLSKSKYQNPARNNKTKIKKYHNLTRYVKILERVLEHGFRGQKGSEIDLYEHIILKNIRYLKSSCTE